MVEAILSKRTHRNVLMVAMISALLAMLVFSAAAYAASAVDITKANVDSDTYSSYVTKDTDNMTMAITFSSDIPAADDQFGSKMTWKFVNDWSGLSGGTTPYDPAYNSVSLKGSNGLFTWNFNKLSASASGPYFANVRIYTPSELAGFTGYTALPAGSENSVFVTTEMTQDLSTLTTASGDAFATLKVKVTDGTSKISAGDTVSISRYYNGATGAMSGWSAETDPQANVLKADSTTTTITDSAVVDSSGYVTFTVPTGGNYVVTWVSGPTTYVHNIDSTSYFKADFAQYVSGIGTTAMNITFNSDITRTGVCFNSQMTWPFVNNFSGFDSVGGGTTVFPAFSPACSVTTTASDGLFSWTYSPLASKIVKGSTGQGPYMQNVRIYTPSELAGFTGYTALPAGDANSVFVTTESTRDYSALTTASGDAFATLKVKVTGGTSKISAGDTVSISRYYNGASGSMSGWSTETAPQTNVLKADSTTTTIADSAVVDSSGYVTFTVPTGGNYVVTWVSGPETYVANIDSTSYCKADLAQYVTGIGTTAMSVTFNSDITRTGVCFNSKMTWPFVNNFSGFDSVGGGTTVFPAFSPACSVTTVASNGLFHWTYSPLSSKIEKGSAGQGPYMQNVRIYTPTDLEGFTGYTSLPAGDANSVFVTTESTRDYSALTTASGTAFATLTVKVTGDNSNISAGDTVNISRYYNGASGSMSGWSSESAPQANALKSDGSTTLIADSAVVDSNGYVTFTVPTGGNYVVTHGILTISGSDRYVTSSDTVSAAVGSSSCKGVIIAAAAGSGQTGSFPDALSGSGLSGVTGYPIVLSASDTLADTTKQTLESMKASNGGNSLDIIVLGGSAAISDNVATQLADYGTVKRLAGSNRYETASAIYTYGSTIGNGWTGTPIIATGQNFPDALAISSYASANSAPVLLVQGDTLATYVSDALAGKSSAVIVGGTAVVSSSIQEQVASIVGASNVTRLGGSSRYETSLNIAKWEIGQGMKLSTVGFATGENFPDALGSSFYMATKDGPLFLVSPDSASNSALYALIEENKDDIDAAVVFGGDSVVSESTKAELTTALGWN